MYQVDGPKCTQVDPAYPNSWGGRLEVVLGGDVDMVGAHSLHHRPRARPHQPGHIGGALVGLGLEGVPLLTGSEDVATRGNVLITDR